MTCFFKGLGFALTLAPVVLMILAMQANDWTVSKRSMITFEPNAAVNEDNVDFRMGPFKGQMQAVAGDKDIFSETGYQWYVTVNIVAVYVCHR